MTTSITVFSENRPVEEYGPFLAAMEDYLGCSYKDIVMYDDKPTITREEARAVFVEVNGCKLGSIGFLATNAGPMVLENTMEGNLIYWVRGAEGGD